MTRARDELVLSHAADYGGRRSRRLSNFVLEALDLPLADGAAGAGAAVTTASSGWRPSRRLWLPWRPSLAEPSTSRSR